MFELTRWLKSQQQRVEALLASRLERVVAHAPPRIAEAMKYSLLDGGKRLRPILVLAFSDAIARQSGDGGAPAEDAAVAIESIHTYSLIHDDLPAMDNDDLRRGRPTSHKQFGEAMAILAGDALLTDAFTILAGTAPSEFQVRGQLVSELARAAGAAGMVGGQVLDIAEDRPAELDYLLRLHRMKTGALIKAACRLGAVAARAEARVLEAADTYGESIGLAFQIADDILDVTSSAEVMGKPVSADAAAGRFTFPAVLGMDRSRSMAAELVTKAQRAVAFLEPQSGPLTALAAYSVERTS